MAKTYLTSADVLKFTLNVRPGQQVVSNLFQAAPLLDVLAASSREGYTFNIPRRTGAASASFRKPNTGVASYSSGSIDNIPVSAGYMDATSVVDVAVAQADQLGVDHALGIDADAHLKAAFFNIEKAIFYGDTDGFNYSLSAHVDTTQSDFCIDAGGTGTSLASAYLLRTDNLNGVELVWGAGGEIFIGQRTLQVVNDDSGNPYTAWVTPISTWAALSIPNDLVVARIANIPATTPAQAKAGNGLTDALILQGIERFPVDRKPNLVVMNRRSLAQLTQSRSSFNPIGKPAEVPDQAYNIPICVVETLTNTESAVGAT